MGELRSTRFGETNLEVNLSTADRAFGEDFSVGGGTE
jgi:hypothetical protein